MKSFKLGALRRATNITQSKRFSAAHNLVRQTLSQHGLLPDVGIGPTGISSPAASPTVDTVFSDPLAGFEPSVEPNLPGADGAQFRSGEFSCSSGARTFRTFVPSTATAGVTGIVVMLHGCSQTPDDFAAGTGMNALAEKHGFVVIYPQQLRGDNSQSCWNWFSRGDQQRGHGEPAVIAGLTQDATAEFGVSKDETFVAGLSAGAAMAVIMGQAYPDVFSGVGAHSGLPVGAATDVMSAFSAMAGNAQHAETSMTGAAAPNTIVFHGTDDSTVHPSNGEKIVQQALDSMSDQTLETDERGSAFGRSFNRRTIAAADGATTLEHWVIDGLGHAWSGGQPNGTYTDAQGPNASAEMIRFFFDLDE